MTTEAVADAIGLLTAANVDRAAAGEASRVLLADRLSAARSAEDIDAAAIHVGEIIGALLEIGLMLPRQIEAQHPTFTVAGWLQDLALANAQGAADA